MAITVYPEVFVWAVIALSSIAVRLYVVHLNFSIIILFGWAHILKYFATLTCAPLALPGGRLVDAIGSGMCIPTRLISSFIYENWLIRYFTQLFYIVGLVFQQLYFVYDEKANIEIEQIEGPVDYDDPVPDHIQALDTVSYVSLMIYDQAVQALVWLCKGCLLIMLYRMTWVELSYYAQNTCSLILG